MTNELLPAKLRQMIRCKFEIEIIKKSKMYRNLYVLEEAMLVRVNGTRAEVRTETRRGLC